MDLPVILTEALAALEVPVPTFLAMLVAGPLWQDKALRSPDGAIAIEAHLGRQGLRCAIRLTELCWYHHPEDQLNVFGGVLPEIPAALRDVPVAAIVEHPLLVDPRIKVRSVDRLSQRSPDLGIRLSLIVPATTCRLPDG